DRRKRAAVAVERRGQDVGVAGLRIDDRDLLVPREVEAARTRRARDQRTVGRPGRTEEHRLAAREPFGLAARGVDRVEVVVELDVPALVTRRDEEQAVTARRPADAVVLEVAVRHLP